MDLARDNNTGGQKFEAIKQIYMRKDLIKGRVRSKPGVNKKGHFFQSDLNQIKNGFNYLIENKIIDINLPFFDAGAGDGRVIAVTSIIFSIPSFGLEYDTHVVEDGIWSLNKLNENKLYNPGIPMELKQGDFTVDEHYKRLGIRFEYVGTFFNFDNNYHNIADKIVLQSPLGTVFLFKRIIQRVETFNGLTFLNQINLSKFYESRYNLSIYKKYGD